MAALNILLCIGIGLLSLAGLLVLSVLVLFVIGIVKLVRRAGL